MFIELVRGGGSRLRAGGGGGGGGRGGEGGGAGGGVVVDSEVELSPEDTPGGQMSRLQSL